MAAFGLVGRLTIASAPCWADGTRSRATDGNGSCVAAMIAVTTEGSRWTPRTRVASRRVGIALAAGDATAAVDTRARKAAERKRRARQPLRRDLRHRCRRGALPSASYNNNNVVIIIVILLHAINVVVAARTRDVFPTRFPSRLFSA